MATVLEARAIITAEDRTGPAFAAIERRIAMLGRMATQINAASSRISAISGKVAQTNAAIASAATAGRRGGLSAGASEFAGAAFGAGGAALGLGAAVAGGMAVHAVAKAATARVHERVRMEASGMTRAEIADAEKAAAELAVKFPAIPQVEMMHMLRNARSIVGSYSEAAEIMEPLAKLRIVAQGARPGQDVSEDFDQLVKGLEIKGVTQNPKQFREYIEGIAKGLNVFGDTLKPYQYYEMFKYGRQATPGLSEKFILSTAPTLAQELGGSSYGKAVAAFNSAIVSNVMKHSAIKDFVSLGLIDKADVELNKVGDAKGFKPGKHVKGWQLAQSDPNEWIKQYLIPALEKAGVTDKGEILQRIGTLFQNGMAAQMVGLLATQQARIDKDAAMLGVAMGTNAANQYMREDPHIAWQGLQNAVKSLAGVLGEDAFKSLTGPMADLATAISRLTESLLKEKARPDNAPPLEQPRLNRQLNRLFTGVDSPGTLAEAQAEADRKERAGKMHRLDVDFAQTSEQIWRELEEAKQALQAAEARGDKNRATTQRLKVAERQRRLDALFDADFARTEAYRASQANEAELRGARVAGAFPMAAGAGGGPFWGKKKWNGPSPYRQTPGGSPEVAGSLSFDPSLGYGNYDTDTGMPRFLPNNWKPGLPNAEHERRDPMDRIREALGTIKATVEPFTVSGSAELEAQLNVHVTADNGLKADIAEVKRLKASIPLSSNGRAITSTGHDPAALGPSMPEARPDASHR